MSVSSQGVAAAQSTGYNIEANLFGLKADKIKTASDGHTVLFPQPSGHEDDPLNWPQKKKNLILAIITCISFTSDYSSATGIPTIISQATEWHQSPATIQRNLVGNIFCLGSGGLIAVALASYFGRLPVIFHYQWISLVLGIAAGAAPSWDSYFGLRIVQGIFTTVGISSGLMWIQDLYFFHEHPRKINIWSLGVIVSPYFGPMVSSFLTYAKDWRYAFWVLTIVNGICLLLSAIFLDETFFNRKTSDPRPVKMSHWARVIGIEQFKNRSTRGSFKECMMRPVVAFSKVPLILITVYYFLNFAWIIGVNTTVSIWLASPPYSFNERDTGLFYISGLIGTGLGWLVGHWLHDSFGKLHARRHKGHIEPEARLMVSHLATLMMFTAILILGFALQSTWHYMTLAVCFGAQICGIMIATVSIDSYLLDAYPEGSGEIGAWTNFARATGGFMATYIQIAWITSSGSEIAFGIQSSIVIASALLIVILQMYGPRIRAWQGPMNFTTP